MLYNWLCLGFFSFGFFSLGLFGFSLFGFCSLALLVPFVQAVACTSSNSYTSSDDEAGFVLSDETHSFVRSSFGCLDAGSSGFSNNLFNGLACFSRNLRGRNRSGQVGTDVAGLSQQFGSGCGGGGVGGLCVHDGFP